MAELPSRRNSPRQRPITLGEACACLDASLGCCAAAGSEAQLFSDDYLVARHSGIRYTLHPAEKFTLLEAKYHPIPGYTSTPIAGDFTDVTVQWQCPPDVPLKTREQTNNLMAAQLIAAIEQKRDPVCSARDGLCTIRMAAAVYESHFMNAPVNFT